MELVADLRHARAAKLQRSTEPPLPRVRPGECACYVRLDLSPARRRALRERAGRLGVAVDVLVTTSAELRALPELTPGTLPEASALIERVSRRPQRLPRTDELRMWCSCLRGDRRTLPDDDLPEILVPVRLASRLDARAWNAAALAALADEADLALQAERLAAAHALTLTEWALREALFTSRPA